MTNENLLKNWRSFATFPCKGNSKHPATRNGFKDAQFGQDVATIVQHCFNVGLACITSGLIVIDCDIDEARGYNGLANLEQLESELGKLPKTLTQQTPRGGKHFIFSSKGVISPRGKLAKDIDVKVNGYIMISPSSINGKFYEIIDGVDANGNFIIAELPQVWLDYINKDTPTNPNKAQTSTNTSKTYKVYSHIDVVKMFNNCAFLRYCRDNADCLSEPEWFSMISVLAQIEDSDELIHGLSEPYPKYSFEETQKKIDNVRAFGLPQSCEYLSANYGNICKNCISLNIEREAYND